MQNRTISHVFLEASKRPTTQVALRYFREGKWNDISWPDYFKLSEMLAGCLASLGVKQGDRVAIMSNTRYEWAVSDMAILGIGAVTVPLYQNNIVEDVEFILNNSEAVLAIAEDEFQLGKLKQIQSKLPNLKNIICMSSTNDKNALPWQAALKKGAEFLSQSPDFFKNEIQKNNLDKIATIVYTSGTTGVPKGAVLPHSCIVSECEDLQPILDVNDSDTTLTFLPFAHIFGRVEMWAHIYFGWKMAFAENIDRIAANLGDIKPTFMLAVPRIFEKIYSRILSQVEEGSNLKKKIFSWAVELGSIISLAKREKKQVPFATLIQYRIAHKLVFAKLHARMGNRMRFMISGSAPLSKEIIEFFHAAGILILEGYGLTETTAGIYFNNPYKYKFGSVGLPIGDVQCKIAEDGEILIKSKKNFREYFKNPEATAEALENGWFHTGDIGVVDEENFLKITDRKKDMIKTAGGKMIAPQKIEGILKLNKIISQVAIYGDKQKYLVALITLNPEEVLKVSETLGLNTKDYVTLTKNQKVLDLVREAVKETNNHLASYETIKNFVVLENELTIDNGEITPSMKVKRKLVGEKYKALIEQLYS
ncbi:MAG: long-chain fatty acid--CoA ligase [Oligoflexia bacterium]|nr:long-chain fatty acid--CoA ligase [Oligoflexia bacterium]